MPTTQNEEIYAMMVYNHTVTTVIIRVMRQLPMGIANAGNMCFAGALLQCLRTVEVSFSAITRSVDALDQLVASMHAAHGAVMHIETPLIHEIYDAEIGLQGQRCPMQFFAASYRKGGTIAESFNVEISEVLKCGTCEVALNKPQISTDNYIQMLKFDKHTTARTLTELILHNVVSARIEGYIPTTHKDSTNTGSTCANTYGAFHVRYFSSTLPQHLCFALASRTESAAAKNARYFEPQLSMVLPELNMASPPHSKDTKNVEYSLFGTVVHSGYSAETGHFSAYVLRDGAWFFIDDEHSRPVSASAVIKPPPHHTIYMVFYCRV